MPTWTYGADASFSRVTRPDFRNLRDNYGVRVFSQCLWPGGYEDLPGIRAVAEANLSDALAEGIVVSGYACTSPFYGPVRWWPPSTSLAEAKLTAGSMWPQLTVVANDVEIRGVVEQDIAETSSLLLAEGKRVPIYTAKWFWDGVLGNPTWPWLLAFPLWNAYYDGDPDIDFLHAPYGPWDQSHVIGEQYQGTTPIAGDDFDLDFFDLDYFTLIPTPIPPQEDDMDADQDQRLKNIESQLSALYARFEGYKINADQLTPANHLTPADAGYVGIQTAVELIWRVRDMNRLLEKLSASSGATADEIIDAIKARL